MKHLYLINLMMCIAFFTSAKTTRVSNVEELNKAQQSAMPGDSIILKNGEWKNVLLSLFVNGTAQQPIVFKAETAGKVMVTGHSRLLLGGNYIVVDGLYFTNGYAGKDAVIKFRVDKNRLATNCRVTNTVINGFNNQKRLDENYWVEFYGKNNRLDHCSFFDKKNMGVLLAVILDDERSRENFHSIDNNYFGFRTPLASNTGEMIRVGVSQHCEFNSNTLITDNYFENCDGETEIVSIKSGSNIIRNNIFKECQGAVVLRHGDHNTVENNIFLGNDKPGTGGVRIINKGQWVVNNYFYKCRGTGFRSPLSVMNGVPNSPAFRYVTASDAVIANNSFIDCAPLSFCEGSDTERTERPFNIHFLNNLLYNKDTQAFMAHDDLSGFNFSGNLVRNKANQQLIPGFEPTDFPKKASPRELGLAGKNFFRISDSLQQISLLRLNRRLPDRTGFAAGASSYSANNKPAEGAKWFTYTPAKLPVLKVDCKSAEEVLFHLKNKKNTAITINLTSSNYNFSRPLNIEFNTTITSKLKTPIHFSFTGPGNSHAIQVMAGSHFVLENVNLDLKRLNTPIFITTDTSGSSNHGNISIINARFSGLDGILFNAAKSGVLDSMIVKQSSFSNMKGTLFNFSNETDKKGFYNVEKLHFNKNNFSNLGGQLLTMLRGGNDESTMGPALVFINNTITSSANADKLPLIYLYGTQQSRIENNQFTNANSAGILVHYEDAVRALHLLGKNQIHNSGVIKENKYVVRK